MKTHLSKLALLSIGLLSAGVMLSAQTAGFVKKTSYGMTVGANVARLTIEGMPSGTLAKSKSGFQFGAFADCAFHQNWSLIPELRYIQKGGKYESGGLIAEFELDYVEAPVNVAFKIDMGDGGRALLFGGVYLAGKVADKAEIGGQREGIDDVKTLDYGLNLGAGYQYGRFSLKLQYSKGLANISDTSGITVKNKECVSLSVGCSF
ncbi:PorT family protein [Termitidicoccus mucosus]|uniref:Outer membrane protein beta-barrel domain-containing protein n=1 Tax=Termitidicoccus mucosus TaxID=1184151 RepID=A0A178IMY1_9BACT|nr:hypothetical protein AW736_00020 [Opitutaceae bacterium TSB47]